MKKKKTKLVWSLTAIGIVISIPFVFLADKAQEKKKKMRFYASRV